jgi:hypothetical protein
MIEPEKIVWLASYPKSGNTWFRVFLSNLLDDRDKPADINQLYNTPIASSRDIFDEATGIPSSELTKDEITRLRPEVYKYIALQSQDILYQKIHDAYLYINDNVPLIPPNITKGAIYFVRNPLDVAISFAHHSAVSIDRMIALMNDPGYTFCSRNDKLHNQLQQKLNTWSGHVKSWTEHSGLPLHIMKYEEMVTTPFPVFKKAVHYLGLNKTDEQIKKALQFSDLKELQKQEKKDGFNEKAPKAKSFFRKGKAGEWKAVLSQKQIKNILSHHGQVMKKFGYM